MNEPWIPPRIAEVMDVVAGHFGCGRAELLGRSRFKTIALARNIAMRLARDEGFSFPELGRAFRRDHTTVMAVCGSVAKRAVKAGELEFQDAFRECALKWLARRRELYPPPPSVVPAVRVRIAEEKVA